MPDLITAVRRGPRACVLSGTTYPVHEARLIDLWSLQDWCDARTEGPCDDLFEKLALAGDDPAARDKVLFQAWLEIEDGQPAFDSPVGTRLLFGTRAGLVEFFRVALTRGTPGLKADDLGRLADAVSRGDAEALNWRDDVRLAFFGHDPVGMIQALLGLFDGVRPPETVTWGEVVCDACREYGWTIEEVMNLSRTEFACVRRGGKPREVDVPRGREAEFQARHWAALHGDSPGETPAHISG